MTTAIFDLSNMFFRSMFIVGGYGSKQYTFDSERETSQLMRKVATDVSQVIRTVNPSRVIFALDSRSWRKDISIDENEGYKGHRKKSEHINWDNIYGIMRDFAKIMESKGFVVSQIDNAEADDLMALWRDEIVVNQNQHAILVSADEDVRQLVTRSKDAFAIVFNPFTQGRNSSKKLFVPATFEDWLNNEDDLGDIFNRSIDVDKEDFQRIINEKVVVEEVDGNEIALKKIFCGDDGDNVPAIFTWINDKEKAVRITPSKYQKIVDYIGAKNYKDLFEKADPIYDQLVEISGQHPPFKMKDRLTRQAKLVVLDAELFPEQIVEDFKEDISQDMAAPRIHPQSWNMQSMLDGTKYIDADYSKKNSEASIFKQIDRISNKELF